MAMPIIHWFYFEKKTSIAFRRTVFGELSSAVIWHSTFDRYHYEFLCQLKMQSKKHQHRVWCKKNKTGVREGWVMSSTLNANIWIMKIKTPDIPRNNRWNTFTTLEDIDFAVNIALFSHSYHYIQYKTNILHKYAGSIRLKNQYWKSEVMIPNVNNPTALKVEYHILPHTMTFT